MSQTAKAYELLSDTLQAAGAVVKPAELHGWLVGGLCVEKVGDTKRVVQYLLEELAIESNEGMSATLQALRELARRQLDDINMTFMLMLPSEDEPLSVQLDALAAWCQGFLTGYGLAGGVDHNREVLEDLAAISQVDTNLDEDDDSIDFYEVSEYVRMAVISQYLEGKNTKVQ